MPHTVTRKFRTWLLRNGLIRLVVLCAPYQGQALTVTVDSATVPVGDSVVLNVNVTDAVDLTAWQFDLSYDPTFCTPIW